MLDFLKRYKFQLLSLFALVSVLTATTTQALINQSNRSQAATTATQTISGTLWVVIEDDFKNSKSKTSYSVQTSDGKLTPINYTGTQKLISGSKVSVTGTVDTTNKLNVSNMTSTTQSAVQVDANTPLSTNSTGVQNVAIMLLNWSNWSEVRDQTNPTTPLTAPSSALVKSYFNSTIKDYFSTNSYSKLDINAIDAFGWYTGGVASCDGTTNLVNARNFAIEKNVDFNLYDQFIVIGQNPDCVGVDGYSSSWPHNNKNIKISFINVAVWSDQPRFTSVLEHEIGHNLGVYHANGYDCGGLAINDRSKCQSLEYGDAFDIMGQTKVPTQFGAYRKWQLGWLNKSDFQEVFRDADIFIAPLETSVIAYSKAVVVPATALNASPYSTYIIENRQSVDGALIYISALQKSYDINMGDTQLIDTTPNSLPDPPGTSIARIGMEDFKDAALKAGQTYSDPISGVNITAYPKDASGNLKVRVKFDSDISLISPANGFIHYQDPSPSIPQKGDVNYVWSALPGYTNYQLEMATLRDGMFSERDYVRHGQQWTTECPLNTDFAICWQNITNQQVPAFYTYLSGYCESKGLICSNYWRVNAKNGDTYKHSEWRFVDYKAQAIFSNLSGIFEPKKATFNFTYGFPSTFTVEMANTKDFSSGIYRNFAAGTGSSGPIVVPAVANNPTPDVMWPGVYKCGATLWWRIISAENITSPIQEIIVGCGSATPTPTPNPGSNAQTEVYIAGIKKNTSPYILPPNTSQSIRYGVNGGPVRVVSPNLKPILTSQRAIYGSSFNSIVGIPANQLTTEYWFTSLDDVGMITYLVIGNPSTTLTATVDVYIGGTKRGTYSIAPGQRVFPRYGVNGGPVRVVSTNGVPIFTSERTKYGTSFNEVLGIPANQLTTEYWFTSLDDVGMITYLVVGNPSTTNALVDVYIGGTKMNTTPYSIAPGQRVFPRYGVNGGPVRVVSTNGVPIFTSERSKFGSSFNEVLGIPANQLTTDYWFTTLDDASMITYLVVGNPSATNALVDVYIGGTKMNTTPYSIAPGQRVFPRYGIKGGPVRVVSTNGVPIFTSERAKYQSSFNEIVGVGANKLTTEYWYTSLDDVGMATELVISSP